MRMILVTAIIEDEEGTFSTPMYINAYMIESIRTFIRNDLECTAVTLSANACDRLIVEEPVSTVLDLINTATGR